MTAIDPLYIARRYRELAATIIRHCKHERACDPIWGGSACLKTTALLRAGEMLAARGFGRVETSPISGYFVFTLR